MLGAGRLALVVDDQRDFRIALEQLLVALGFRVTCAASGVEAMARLLDEPPALILLDLFMPGMDGIELLSQLQTDGRPVPPTIALTGYIDHQHGVGRTAELLGANAGLLKPFTKHQLETTIAAVLHLPAVDDGALGTADSAQDN